ncbi:MAG: hypothetical protein Q4C87_11305, partial [Actinomycetaceae bacterium]|nr:hypothetical protein [Actinomycetaceae bacterium]
MGSNPASPTKEPLPEGSGFCFCCAGLRWPVINEGGARIVYWQVPGRGEMLAVLWESMKLTNPKLKDKHLPLGTNLYTVMSQ